ncbi:MAG: Mth938-like domain-containing protein [Gammaproteobacteria bacterium]|nr:Mth938-like domain-containing protein [Gammaproteobacteria bacterium]
MIISEDQADGSYQIKAYEDGMIKVNDREYHQSLIVSAHQLIDDWRPQTVSELTTEDFQRLASLSPKMVLLGTGKKFNLLPASLLADLYQRQIGVECMDTAAACRTFVALSSEGREVVAALLIR